MTTLTIDQKIAGLRRAQNALRERGWCKGAFQDDERRICANGAVSVATGRSALDWPFPYDDGELLRQELVQDMGPPSRPCMDSVQRLCVFNNGEAETVEDVIAQFQITIDRLEREQALVEHRELVAV